MEAQTTGYGVEQLRVGDGNGDNLGDIEFEEVCVAQDCNVVGVAGRDEDEERDGDEVEEGSDKGRVAASDGAGHCGVGTRRSWMLRNSLGENVGLVQSTANVC